jgi:hypothetical protein
MGCAGVVNGSFRTVGGVDDNEVDDNEEVATGAGVDDDEGVAATGAGGAGAEVDDDEGKAYCMIFREGFP